MPALLERSEEYLTGRSDIPERLLAGLWQKRAARQRDFRTAAGRRVRVLYPGRPGVTAGPDFRDALLEMEGLGLVQGDVELHLRQQDWYAHGHADDPNYNGVVLHAALEVSARPTNLHNGGQAPSISLAGLLDEASSAPDDDPAAGDEAEPAGGGLWPLLERQGWPRPSDALAMGALLDAAGDARFREKAALFHAFNREQGPAQTLYEGLLEALGYRANRQPFLKLAQVAPWATLAREAAQYPAAQWAQVIEARLLQLSGLAVTGAANGPGNESATKSGNPAGIETGTYRETEARPAARAKSGSGYGRPMAAAEWHCFRVRPANHPRHRIGGAARLLARFLARAEETSASGAAATMATAATNSAAGPETALAAGLSRLVAAGNPASLTAALAVPAEDGKGPACVGVARAKDIAVNVALPFCHALALRPGGGAESNFDTELAAETPALALYRKFGKLQDNEITREMAEQLLAPAWEAGGKAGGKIVATARRQQGLLHLRRRLTG